MEENKYCVYMHTCLKNNKKYIGITNNIKIRWGANGKNYKSQYFYRAINKYGWDNFKHEVLLENLSKEEANKKEIELIEKYDTTNKENGYNISNGGGQIEFTEETRLKMSLARKGIYVGVKSPMYGKKHTKESILKIKESLSKIDKSLILQLASEATSIPVVQFNKKGEMLNKWKNIKSASKESGISENTIIRCCKGITKNVTHDFIWIYESDFERMSHAEFLKIIYNLNISPNSIPIVQLDLNGELISEWESAIMAERNCFLGNKSASSEICACCKGKLKTAMGYKWMYKDDYFNMSKDDFKNKIKLEKIKKGSNAILQFSMNGNFIKEFSSTSEIKEELGFNKFNINQGCKKDVKSSYGYIWIKKEDYILDPNILKNKMNKKRKNAIQIVQLTLEGEFIKIWSGAYEAKQEGFSDSRIAECCKNKRESHKGFMWMYYSEYKLTDNFILDNDTTAML